MAACGYRCRKCFALVSRSLLEAVVHLNCGWPCAGAGKPARGPSNQAATTEFAGCWNAGGECRLPDVRLSVLRGCAVGTGDHKTSIVVADYNLAPALGRHRLAFAAPASPWFWLRDDAVSGRCGICATRLGAHV